jgi:hypothetical protein
MRWLWILALLAFAPLASANTIDVNIVETGKVTSYLNTYWVVHVHGNGTIHNPSERDLYDVRLYFDILGLSLIDHGGTGYFEGDSLRFGHLPASSTATFSYELVGITAEPPTLAGRGVLYTAMAKRTPRIYSDVFGELQKAPLEDRTFTGRDGRLVSVTLRNPTSFQFTIESMRVFKTPTLNPNQVLDSWQVVNASQPRVLDPDGFFVHDVLDTQSAEGHVYWLHSDVYISRVELIDQSNLSRFTELNLTIPIEELNFTNATDNQTLRFTSGYAIRKQLSNSVALPGQPLQVMLVLHNMGDTLARYTLTDRLPTGFYADRVLSWSGEIPQRGTSIVRYSAVLNDSATAGFDIFPSATAIIEGKTVRSPEVAFVRQFVSDERVFVQKKVSLRDDDYVQIRLTVQNLGRSPLVGATLKEHLRDQDLFSEISKSPSAKGLWEIPSLSAGEQWEVTYVTESGPSLSVLPQLYGAGEHQVLRSLVLEHVVRQAWRFVRTRAVEFVGLFFIVAVPLLLYLGRRNNWFN